MNFLAHLYLSGNNPEILTGNFIGDFVKGKIPTDQFGPGMAKGIALHREIDWFTDTHQVVKQSKDRLRPKYRHYSGVIVDVFYDHFLAKNWENYSEKLLPAFADECYSTLQQQKSILPEEVNYMLPFMINGNWLVNYAGLEGIHKALTGMAKRTRFESKMEESVADLQNDYGSFKKEFELFFPAIVLHCQSWLEANSTTFGE